MDRQLATIATRHRQSQNQRLLLLIRLLLLASNLCWLLFSNALQPSFVRKQSQSMLQKSFRLKVMQQTRASESVVHSATASVSISLLATSDDAASSWLLPDDLIHGLDLLPLIGMVARHCGTFRGRQALMRLVGAEAAVKANTRKDSMAQSPSRRNQLLDLDSTLSSCQPYTEEDNNFTRSKRLAKQLAICPIALSAQQAMQAYQQVAQAAECIRAGIIPPFYAVDSLGPLDTTTAQTTATDDDEWLDFSPFAVNRNNNESERWTLEHVLQAEHVLAKLVAVHEWSMLPRVASVAPDLVAADDDSESSRIQVDRLRSVLSELRNAVEIVRVRTLTDASARSSYQFRLSGKKFPVLAILRERCSELQNEQLCNSAAATTGKRQDRLKNDVTAIQDEIAAKEGEIQAGLVQAIYSARRFIDDGLNAIAKLDVIFAKAAFGCSMSGGARCAVVAAARQTGTIHVEQFVHPLLQFKSDAPAVVPIDLFLGRKESSSRAALIISGTNGGGKTVAMKSFGLVSVMAKLAIPIVSSSVPVVDFFDNILVSVGDYQNVQGGESTFTAQLNRYASLIDRVSGNNGGKSHLVLLDELGAGTEEAAGGAIGQALLEKLLQTKSCRLVATTHSPLLKTLSFNSAAEIGCAAVLLQSKNDENGSSDGYLRPSYRLQYNCIGESYAFGAASRCLPDDVVTRASSLMSHAAAYGNDSSATAASDASSYMRALKESLEFQLDVAAANAALAEELAQDTALIRRAMLSLASSYDDHLAKLEQRVEQCYQSLKEQTSDDGNSVQVLGNTLAELRAVRTLVKSEKELLRERGLKRLPGYYDLSIGETIVVVDESSAYNGITGTVASRDDLPFEHRQLMAANDVVVAYSGLAWDDVLPSNNDIAENILVANYCGLILLKRCQLAVWDYASVWDDDKTSLQDDSSNSIPDSKRKLSSLLSKLKAVNSNPRSSAVGPLTTAVDSAQPKSSFLSSRERKSAKRKGKIKK